MHPLERLVNLVALLLEARRPLTFDQIRDVLPAYRQGDKASAKRQFERDKDTLRAIGIPVEVAPTDVWEVEEGYRIPRERYELPEVEFTAEEAAALFVAAHAGIGGEAAQAFRKLALGVDTGVLTGLAEREGNLGVDAAAPHLSDVADAVARRRRVRFRYRPLQGRAGERDVDAWGLVFRRGSWYLVGRDRKRGEARSFRLSRFASVLKDLGEAEPPPEGFRASDQLQAGPWGLGEPETTARVSFSPKVAWWALSGLPGARIVRTGRDGWTEAEVPAAGGDAFASWILSFGADARVLSPKALRDAVVDRLESVLRAIKAG
ncbi:MAG: helix-turn-helix transcriptional regulator [Actinomycetota bacterium]